MFLTKLSSCSQGENNGEKYTQGIKVKEIAKPVRGPTFMPETSGLIPGTT